MNTNKNELNMENLSKEELLGFEKAEIIDLYIDKSDENFQLKYKVGDLLAKVKYYEELLRISRSEKYCPKTEQTNTEAKQLKFPEFDEVEEVYEESTEEEKEEPVLKKKVVKRKAGKVGSKKEAFDDLEVIEVIHDTPKEERVCGKCNSKLEEIGRTVREEIVIEPVKIKKVRHITINYGCPSCKVNAEKAYIITSKSPKPVLAGSYSSASLISWVICKKYWEKCPLYRMEKILETCGIEIPRATMSNWVIKSTQMYLEAIYEKMHEELLKLNVVHADETPMLVIEDGREKKSKSYMWYYTSGEREAKKISLYEYTPTRAGDNAVKFLTGFKGYLQSDAFSGYNKVTEAIRVGCMVHARRKFVDAEKALGKNEASKKTLSREGIDLFDRIFYFENSINHLTSQEIYEARIANEAKKETAVIEPLKKWIDKNILYVAKKSKLGDAFSYAQKNFEYLTNYMLDGAIDISNNKAERGIKEFVIGRKNSLFSYTPNGAQGSAICYSIVETAKANKLNPYEYIKYILEELSNNKMTDEKLNELMPWSEKLPEEIKSKRK